MAISAALATGPGKTCNSLLLRGEVGHRTLNRAGGLLFVGHITDRESTNLVLEAYPAIRRVADENRLILALEEAALIVAINGATLTTVSVWNCRAARPS